MIHTAFGDIVPSKSIKIISSLEISATPPPAFAISVGLLRMSRPDGLFGGFQVDSLQQLCVNSLKRIQQVFHPGLLHILILKRGRWHANEGRVQRFGDLGHRVHIVDEQHLMVFQSINVAGNLFDPRPKIVSTYIRFKKRLAILKMAQEFFFRQSAVTNQPYILRGEQIQKRKGTVNESRIMICHIVIPFPEKIPERVGFARAYPEQLFQVGDRFRSCREKTFLSISRV